MAKTLPAVLIMSWQLLAKAQELPAGSPGPQYLVKGKPVGKNVYEAMVLSNQARELLNSNQSEKALENMKKAAELAPELPEVQCNLGTTLAKLGRSDEAVEHLEKATALDPGLAVAWMTLGSVYQSVGRTRDAVRTFKEFERRFPGHEYAGKIKGLIMMLEREANEQAKSKGSPDEYFDLVGYGGGITKWNANRMPIKVYVRPADKVPGYKPEYADVVTNAFNEWSQATNGKVTFQFVTDPTKGDIQFAFSNDIKEVSNPAEGGEAKIFPSASGIARANIVVLTLNPTPELALTPGLVRWICLHEIGHSLGLMGHSTKPGDIMFASLPLANQDRGLSERDRKTVQHLYSDDVAIKPAAAPPASTIESNNPMQLNNEAAMALQSGNVDVGIAKLEKALKLDAKLKVAKDNLAQAYSMKAMKLCQTGKSAEADSWFKKAIALLDNGPNSPIGASVYKCYALYLRLSKRVPEAMKLEASMNASSASAAK
ncbi:MAG TPA: tetratricopeptide repeat protein [Candidatus Obscuribacterales bacterium]